MRRKRPITGMLRFTPRGDVRNREPLAVDHVRKQQIIHVAAMAGHVDDLGAVADLAQFLDVLELDAVIEAQFHSRPSSRAMKVTKDCE